MKATNVLPVVKNEKGVSYAYNFGGEDWKQNLIQAYSFRFTETPDFKKGDGYVTTAVNVEHREGFDNISLLSPKTFSNGVKATLRCAFEGLGCPEIILVKKPEKCDDGAVRYGECFEIVLYQKGVNVWRHFMDENYKCSWHKRLGLLSPMEENKIHELTVEVNNGYISYSVNGVGATLRTDDLFEEFYVGVTACEGIARLYDLKIEY